MPSSDDILDNTAAGVRPFVMPDLDEAQPRKSHKKIKSQFSKNLTSRDAQFRISGLVAGQLSVEEEDRIRFESAVETELKRRIDELSNQEREKARLEGLEIGKKEGFESEREKLSGLAERIEKLIASLGQLTVRVFAEHEAMIMEFVSRFASLVARTEAKANNEYLISVLKEIIERCGSVENIKIRLNKNDTKDIETLKQRLQQHFGEIKGLQFEQDDAIEQHGCLVETEYGEIRTCIEDQLKAFEAAILAKVPKGSNVSN